MTCTSFHIGIVSATIHSMDSVHAVTHHATFLVNNVYTSETLATISIHHLVSTASCYWCGNMMTQLGTFGSLHYSLLLTGSFDAKLVYSLI